MCLPECAERVGRWEMCACVRWRARVGGYCCGKGRQWVLGLEVLRVEGESAVLVVLVLVVPWL